MPPKLDVTVDRGEAFSLWEQRWSDFSHLSGLAKKEPSFQMALLRSCLADDTLKVVLNLQLGDNVKDKPDEVIAALKRHVQGQLNVVIKSTNFNLRDQKEGESLDDFLTDLREL